METVGLTPRVSGVSKDADETCQEYAAASDSEPSRNTLTEECRQLDTEALITQVSSAYAETQCKIHKRIASVFMVKKQAYSI
jgi:hypothetical protein